MAGTTGTRTESARRGKERLPDCIRCQPAAREAGRARRGGARRTVGPALRQAELCRCGPLAETARTAMAAGSAPGWAVGTLGVVCLFLKLDFISCRFQDIYGAKGGNVTFYTSKFQPFTEITWKKGKDKVIEWVEHSEPEAFQSFKDRAYLDTVSGNLTITKLTKSDEGGYEIESPSVKDISVFYLSVIAPLPSPSASCFLTDDGNITLTCEIMGRGDDIDDNLIQFSWECPSAIQCHRGSISAEAYVSQQSDLSQSVDCIISNPLFSTSTSITLSTCVPVDNSRHRYVLFAILPAVICGLLFLKCFLGRRSQ
ncbi:lymphocyte function-associated antigen 3 [Dama dama]|uniref:lymphocyte function-associated antigen 3 n=1 Tax=Dama dama TaxID=30532 RepID=UPI002A360E38|nr:lymphocyte function-associated antigen 3 [Dama dama]